VAKAQVAAARASVETIDAQMVVQQAQINAGQAQVDQAQAALVFAQQQAKRYRDLAATAIAGTVQDAQRYTSQLYQQQATLQGAQANLKLAQRQIEALRARRASAVASLAQARAQRDQAQLNLSYTTVTADQPGRIVQLSAAVGEFAQPGTNLTMFVPDDIWVWANFKETQLDHMRPGQKVTLEIDAYPERAIHGHVDSVQPGSGTAFSLLPAENATGNYVKIVQRVPVKLVIDNLPRDVALGPGMSVDPTVRVEPARSLLERLLGFWFIARARMLFSAAFPLMFIPITAASYDGIPPDKTGQASALINAARNTGGSIGISLISNVLWRREQFHQSRLVDQTLPSSVQYQDTLHQMTNYFVGQGTSPAEAPHQAIARIGQQVLTQASFLAYMDALWMLMLVALAAVPLALSLRNVKLGGGAPADH
jgi:multidrug resistance efflux pump